jgi:hypothetical protein
MQQHDIEQLLKRFGISAKLRYARTLPSAVTTAWGVGWDEVFIARDLMQNFFDANRGCLEAVHVRNKGTDTIISAPTSFNLERLFYLGSEKADDDVGQYGEGFKVAATCLLRDHAVTPIAVSGKDVVVLKVAERAVANTRLRPVEYDFYQNGQEMSGTALILPGCSGKLAKALAEGLHHFFYEKNPLLGTNLWSDHKNEFSIYKSTNDRGHLFYRKLKRGEMEGIPLILVIDKQYAKIEGKISKDRDRNAFGEEVMKLFYSHFVRYGLKWRNDGQRVIVTAAQSSWEKGHPLLSEIAEMLRSHHSWPADLAREVFGDKYYARSANHSDGTAQLEIERMERAWRDEGRISLPGYFRKFGVLNAEDEMRRVRDKATEESKRNNQRHPTAVEYNAIRLLSKVLQELAPEINAVFNKGATSYTVARTDIVLGQLKHGRAYRSREVFLAESVFVADFPNALATFLHEHAHIFGYDASRGFTDALTELLETVVRHRHDLDQYEAGWEKVKASVQGERATSRTKGEAKGVDEWLSLMDESALRELIARLPTVVLKKLRADYPESATGSV